jgi:hypothetical protein
VITREISLVEVKDKYTFQILTYDNDQYIFRSKYTSDLEVWLESICSIVNLIRENKYLIMFSDDISKTKREIYEKEVKVFNTCFKLKGLLSIYEGRRIFFK